MKATPFWRTKTLDQMSAPEWESLCDGCGKCCLNKLEDWDTGEIAWTNVACRLFDDGTCRCGNYEERFAIVPECIQLTPAIVRSVAWLPPTCAYRLVDEGADLYWWHPLVSGDAQTVHEAGISARKRTVSEETVAVEDYEDFIVEWPEREPG
ncbi:YcgN family cysteine cluster protein [Pararhizobium mangrovi]|uniref:UPF0260 protein FJU11_00470 n=1 Tax=Pararhizobium mangrovi TaxID=2590452 RepID=A0A506UHD6_9HYPH|nr:YcgN family cysteine cluster protein [Pararhizobium mangrovi]TPW32735.1 YcgN family cysteine cluster protein [Pararhizobium mangrovi]